jgi:hypothetical protein
MGPVLSILQHQVFKRPFGCIVTTYEGQCTGQHFMFTLFLTLIHKEQQSDKSPWTGGRHRHLCGHCVDVLHWFHSAYCASLWHGDPVNSPGVRQIGHRKLCIASTFRIHAPNREWLHDTVTNTHTTGKMERSSTVSRLVYNQCIPGAPRSMTYVLYLETFAKRS